MEQLKNKGKDLIFSLDIGTKTIIGIVGEYSSDEKFNILAYSIREHKKRNMYDGQIHDIDGVTKLVIEIKQELEEKVGTSLRKVSIAAAGRSLKTCKVRVDKEIDRQSEITRNMVEILELEAVQKGQEKVNNENNQSNLKYYSIGYTVINYFLDDNLMNKLEGHRAEKIGVTLLATFLPQMVVEGLYSVISKAGLVVGNITLEPIAAINVAIKEELRLLNLALVDIGAGTSDIALTKEGNIMAYAMTSKAGDEITETISKKYLLDFKTSEKLKVKLSSQENHEFIDVVGIKHELTTKEIVDDIYDIIVKICQEIAEGILEFNEKAPDAVFLIGGSSQMPGLKECLAESLGLPKERVSIRDTSFIDNIEGIDHNINGPDIVTPIGIAIEGVNQKYNNFLQLEFNGEEIRIFNTENLKVSDVLIITNYNPRNLIPKSGEDFIYYLNNEKKTIKGEKGSPAKIYVNDEIGNLNTQLKDRDTIDIIDGSEGQVKVPRLYDCIPEGETITFNNNKINLMVNIKINEVEVLGNPKLNQGDRIEIDFIETIDDLIEYMGEYISIDNISINGKKANKNTALKANDKIVTFKNKTIRLIINGVEKTIEHTKKEFIFVDIFDYIDFDLTKPKGSLVLKVNGEDAEYMASLNDGDVIQIYWNK